MYDIIGDIHGYADPLKRLLLKMGYEKKGDGYRHSERKALFVGDYIDRGPQILDTLRIVRTMQEEGDALALMGNHEYNALCFHFPNEKGGHLRSHSLKNIHQHYETLKAFKAEQELYLDYLEWFKVLPLYFEDDKLRAVHACWDDERINFLKSTVGNEKLTDDFIVRSTQEENELFTAVDQTLKGVELKLPEGCKFKDHEHNIREEIRIKWWENPANFNYRTYSLGPAHSLPETAIDLNKCTISGYGQSEKPVFFGHYWFQGLPQLIKPNVCCVDYSVANKGVLVAYRHDGESILDPGKFIYERA
ncbi:MAG: metallophosphoesterase [Cryomorphaceae bacterium]|jgi:hypothetical protein|nr:metallophosphoesterase [Cryomorphaceae bacterium]